MYYVYILKSQLKDWYYIGQTENIEKRLEEHNKGLSKSTKPYYPFNLIYKEVFRRDLNLGKEKGKLKDIVMVKLLKS